MIDPPHILSWVPFREVFLPAHYFVQMSFFFVWEIMESDVVLIGAMNEVVNLVQNVPFQPAAKLNKFCNTPNRKLCVW
jgi:hypothetical protein